MIEITDNYYSFAGFSDVCHVLYRNIERFGLSASIILCKLSAADSGDVQKDISFELQETIGQSIGNKDAYTKYSDTQFVILVMGDQAECDRVCSMIESNLAEKTGKKIDVEFSCSPLDRLKPID